MLIASLGLQLEGSSLFVITLLNESYFQLSFVDFEVVIIALNAIILLSLRILMYLLLVLIIDAP